MSSDTNAGYGFTAAKLDEPPSDPLYPHHSPGIAKELIATARALVAPGKGIYATDETPEGIAARHAVYETEKGSWTPEQLTERRKAWRETLYQALPTEHISGVILYSETLMTFNLAPLLIDRGIIPGVRVDTDGYAVPGSPPGSGELATQGLDDLYPRCVQYRQAGARFTKWRAPFIVDDVLPSHAAIEAQSEGLARFASISQQAGLVPIVEPDLSFSGNASLQRSIDVHIKVISTIYAKLATYGVLIEGTLLKPSFPLPGLQHSSAKSISPAQIGEAAATVLARSIPVAVPGIVFLSGGLSDEDSVAYLNAANKFANGGSDPSTNSETIFGRRRLPPMTFSFGRGLQGGAMKLWVQGDPEGAKREFAERAATCSRAALGSL